MAIQILKTPYVSHLQYVEVLLLAIQILKTPYVSHQQTALMTSRMLMSTQIRHLVAVMVMIRLHCVSLVVLSPFLTTERSFSL